MRTGMKNKHFYGTFWYPDGQLRFLFYFSSEYLGSVFLGF